MPVANNERGEVLVKLGGQVHRLRPSFAAIVEVRKESGVPLGVSFARLRQFDLVEAAIILGATMRANGHKLTNEQVGEMMLADGLEVSLRELTTLVENMLTGGAEPGALGEARAAETERSPSAAMPASPMPTSDGAQSDSGARPHTTSSRPSRRFSAAPRQGSSGSASASSPNSATASQPAR